MLNTIEDMRGSAVALFKKAGERRPDKDASISLCQDAQDTLYVADVCERLDRGNKLMERIIELLEVNFEYAGEQEI